VDIFYHWRDFALDPGTEYFGSPELREYEMYLAMENIPHTRTWARSLQTNGIVERLRKTMLNGFHRIAFRRKIYDSILALQTDLDVGLDGYNNGRQHQGRWCYGKTPMCTFLDSLEFAKEQLITDFAYPITRQVKSRLIQFSDSGTFVSRPSLQHGG
jgi:hypothetical protein